MIVRLLFYTVFLCTSTSLLSQVSLEGEWSGKMGIGKDVQYFRVQFNKVKKDKIYGILFDSFLQDGTYCYSEFEGFYLGKNNSKILIEGKKILKNNNSKGKSQHTLSMLFLEVFDGENNVLKAKIARLGEYGLLNDETNTANEFLLKKIDWKDFLALENTLSTSGKKKGSLLSKKKVLSQSDSIEKLVYQILVNDFDDVDADVISIYVNEGLVRKNVVIQEKMEAFDVTMPYENNSIKIVAEDEGKIPPTTVQIRFLKNDSVVYEIPVKLKKGESHTYNFVNTLLKK